MPCSFDLLRSCWSGGGWSAQRPSRSDRGCPLDTAGDRCLWHVGGTAGENDVAAPVGEGSPPAGRVRLIPGDDGLVGKPRSGAAASDRPGSWSVEPPAPAALGGAHATTIPVPITRAPGGLVSRCSPAFHGATDPRAPS